MTETINLFYQANGSDKVYQASIEESENGYVVNFCFGRRGSTLQTGTKTTKSVSLDAAQKIFKQLIASKMAKGYVKEENGSAYTSPIFEERVSGINCQLLNSIEENELLTYLENENYGAQEKLDGNRMMIRKTAQLVEGINRKGLIIAIPKAMETETIGFENDIVLDGEAIGDFFYAFDLISHRGEILHDKPFKERYNTLKEILNNANTNYIKLVELVSDHESKKQLLESLRKNNKEGIVFKELNAEYRAGRPASGGSQIKFKFYASATVKVEKVNLKRSVSVCILENNKWISIGNVTIPPNTEIPAAGSLIEVRYLYAYKGGSLYQPTYLGLREDIEENECTIEQLKYKE